MMLWSLDSIPVDDFSSVSRTRQKSMAIQEKKECRTAQAHFGYILIPRNERLGSCPSLLWMQTILTYYSCQESQTSHTSILFQQETVFIHCCGINSLAC